MKQLVYTLKVVIANDIDVPSEITDDLNNIDGVVDAYVIEKVEVMLGDECKEYIKKIRDQKID